MATTSSSIVAVGDAAYPTPAQIRDAILRAISFAFSQKGLVANVGVGSDHYVRASAYASRVSIAIANGKIALTATNPLTAQGNDLIAYAAVFGVFPRAASAASGPVIVKVSGGAPVTIPAVYQGQVPSGQVFKTIAINTVSNGGSVQVIGLTPGTASNQGEGTQFVWQSASIGALNIQATVGVGGLEGGVDSDVTTLADGTLNVEPLRQRLLFKLANPGAGGNSALIVEWAEASTAAVEAGYAFAAARGPGSYDVAVTKAGGDRSLNSAALAVVAAYIASRMPGSTDLNLTSVTAQPVDAVIGATLPLPQTAGGAGGGWLDATPWPAEDAEITDYDPTADPTFATVATTTAPVVGNHIGIWNPRAVDADGNPAPAMTEYIVSSVGGGVGAWTFSVQGGFSFDPTDGGSTVGYVSAGAVNLKRYANDIAAQFALLGPGEKTTSVDILPRGRRFPGPDVQAAAVVSNNLLAQVSQKRTDDNLSRVYPEIIDLQFTARLDSTSHTTRTGPDVPATTADPPNIITLKNLSIRKL